MAVVYTASHLSLAALEYLVHIDPEDVPGDLVALGLQVPRDASELVCGPTDLPAGWREIPPPPECREVGDRWVQAGEHLLLRLPSVLVPEEANVLMNPAHPAARRVRVAVSRQAATAIPAWSPGRARQYRHVFDITRPSLRSGPSIFGHRRTGFAHRPR